MDRRGSGERWTSGVDQRRLGEGRKAGDVDRRTRAERSRRELTSEGRGAVGGLGEEWTDGGPGRRPEDATDATAASLCDMWRGRSQRSGVRTSPRTCVSA